MTTTVTVTCEGCSQSIDVDMTDRDVTIDAVANQIAPDGWRYCWQPDAADGHREQWWCPACNLPVGAG